MSVSIITCTARPNPRFEWLADSIAASYLPDPIEIEWIVVDALLWTREEERRRELDRAIRGRIPFRHLPPKPCRWQGPNRLTKSNYFALNNARNTGLCYARGRRIILLDDCTAVDERWLMGHLSRRDCGIAGAYCSLQHADVVEGRVVKADPGPYGWDKRREIAPTARPTNGGWGFGLNTSFPLEAALAANGFDEMYDGQAGSEDSDAGVRFERTGTPYFWLPDCFIYQILGTHDPVFEHVGWGMPIKTTRRPKEAIVRRDGQSHFANELLAERLVLDDVTRYLPLGNPFSLTGLRQMVQEGKEPRHDILSEYDWRDGQPLNEME